MNRDLTKLDQGERVWVWRKQSDLTGHEAAEQLGIGRSQYWDVEMGRRSLDFDGLSIGRPSLSILLELARKRSGKGLLKTARAVRVSHPTLIAMERRGDERLREYWEKQGFSFSK